MRIRGSRGLVAALTAAVLVAAGATPAVAEDDPPWTTVPGTEVDVDGLQASFETVLLAAEPWNIGAAPYAAPVLFVRPLVRNASTEARWVGLAMDIAVDGALEPLWEPGPWGEVAVQAPGFEDGFWAELAPGESLGDHLGLVATGVPSWSGRTFRIVELSGPPASAPTATVLTETSDPGRFAPVRFDVFTEQGIPEIGSALEIAATGAASDLFPGVAATVQASGLVPDEELELWLAPGFDYFFLFLLGGGLPPDAVRIGTGAVAADGTLRADVVLPHDLELGDYQLVAGDPDERYWPAGSRADFVITQPDAAAVSIALTRPRGEHVYAVAFSNAAGTTWSATIRVKMK